MSTDDFAPENMAAPDPALEEVDRRLNEDDEVTREDLGTQDLIDDGTDAAGMTPESLERPVDEALHVDEPGGESIDERLQQEQPDIRP